MHAYKGVLDPCWDYRWQAFFTAEEIKVVAADLSESEFLVFLSLQKKVLCFILCLGMCMSWYFKDRRWPKELALFPPRGSWKQNSGIQVL